MIKCMGSYLALLFWLAVIGGIWVYFFSKRASSIKALANYRAEHPEASDSNFLVKGIRKELFAIRYLCVIGTALCLWAAWGFGIQGIQQEQKYSAEEEQWFQDYEGRHERAWAEACDSFFFSEGNTTGVLYRDGRPYTVDWCNSLWSPPEIPAEYDTSQRPESQPPYAALAVFGVDAREFTYCSNAYEPVTCFGWERFESLPSRDSRDY